MLGLPPAPNSPVPICTPGRREEPLKQSVLPKNKTQHVIGEISNPAGHRFSRMVINIGDARMG